MKKNTAILFTMILMLAALAISANAAAPANDNFAQAEPIVLQGDATTVHSTNVEATREVNEPIHYSGTSGECSVWYKWTASERRAMQIELSENFGSSMSIYRSAQASPAFADLVRVNSATDASSVSGKYQMRFASDAGVTYYIAIDSALSMPHSGTFDITVRRFHYRYAAEWNSTDMRSSLSVFRPSDGVWHSIYEPSRIELLSTSNMFSMRWGQAGDTPVTGDFAGFGRSAEVVTRNINGQKVWMFENSFSAPGQFYTWGLATDTPLTGDFDNDGRADLVALRKGAQGLEWYVRQSTNGALKVFNWGLNTDKPVLGDFDGDGATDVAVTRVDQQGKLVWHILLSGLNGNTPYGQYTGLQFGLGSDMNALGDFDGDLKTDIAVYRPADGNWYILRSSDQQLASAQFGAMGDIPQPSDYDGDGKADFGVYRQSTSEWFMLLSTNNTMKGFKWGAPGDIPIASFNALLQ